LDALIRELDTVHDLDAVTLGDHLRRYGTAGGCRPAASSWGERGYNAAWLRPETGWVYLGLHQAAEELGELLRRHRPGPDRARELRLLRQAARSLLLAQSSDWTFHMDRGAAAGYAQAQVRCQLARFAFLADTLRGGRDPGLRLEALEYLDNLFPDLDLAHFVGV
jgi:1,4-alpha-glucan branching enzyme